MKIDLSGKVTLVTGSTGGIGLVVAAGLAGAGAAVLVNGRSRDRTGAAVAGTGVTVNAVLPGPTLSDNVVVLLRSQARASQAGGAKTVGQAGREFMAQHRPSYILRRAANVEKVANMVVSTASPQAPSHDGRRVAR